MNTNDLMQQLAYYATQYHLNPDSRNATQMVHELMENPELPNTFLELCQYGDDLFSVWFDRNESTVSIHIDKMDDEYSNPIPQHQPLQPFYLKRLVPNNAKN